MRNPSVRYDIGLIIKRLRDTAEQWVPRFFPHGRRYGAVWRLANIRGDPPRRSGSCVIALTGQHAGDWFDFDDNTGGGPLSTLGTALGLRGGALIEEAAKMTGVNGRTDRRGDDRRDADERRAARQKLAKEILAQSTPASDTPVTSYLSGRGLELPANSDLFYHPSLLHSDSGRSFPALVAPIRSHDGKLLGIHRTYLEQSSDGGFTKADIEMPKKMLGRAAGGAVRLTDPAGSTDIVLAEGIETALSITTARSDLRVWATLSTTGLSSVQLPHHCQRVAILADHDESGAGLRAAETAATRLRAEGRSVGVGMPPRQGDDLNTVLQWAGADAVASLVAETLAKATTATASGSVHYHPLNFVHRPDARPKVDARDGDLGRIVRVVWGLLQESNRQPWLYRLANHLAWVVIDDGGLPAAVALDEERLRYMLAELGQWYSTRSSGEEVPTPPPLSVVRSVLATPNPPVPVLTGIVNTPVFGSDGTLVTTPGYHPAARLLYVPPSHFELPPISNSPTQSEIAAARELICVDLLGDFPFVSTTELAHAVALLLAGFLRCMVDGPTPLHLIEKPTAGAGATLLVDCVATILTGAGASVMTEGNSDDEWRKRLTAKLRQLPSILLIDNLRSRLDTGALAAALTATSWEDRILGSSDTVRIPIRCLWLATGNNPEVSNEIARRTVRIRLDPGVEQPWRRSGFRHPDLIAWVRRNRSLLVGACLTLCQAWVAAGRPQGDRVVGSYEGWARSIGGALMVAGIEGFLGNLDEVALASDAEEAALRAFVGAWWAKFESRPVGAAELFKVALATELPIGLGNEKSQRTRLGIVLGRLRDRTFAVTECTVQVKAAGVMHQAQRWHLRLIPCSPTTD